MLSNPKKTKDDIIQWICDYFAENGPDCSAVIGISGGKDSTIAAALCVEALGRDRVFGVMMPNGIQPDIADSCCGGVSWHPLHDCGHFLRFQRHA